MHTGPSGLYSVFLPIHLAAHPTNSVRTPTKSTYIHIRLPTTPFRLRPYPSTISVWTLWPYPSIPQLHPSGHPPNPSGLAYPSTSTFDCPQLHSDSDHIHLPFLSGLCGLIHPSHNSIHPAIHQIHLGLPIHPHPHLTVHNSIQTPTISVYHFCLGSVALSVHPTTPSGLRATPFTFLPFLDKPSELRLVSVHHLWTTFYLTGPGAHLFLPRPISWPLCHFRFIHPSICQLRQLWTLSIHPSNFFFLDTLGPSLRGLGPKGGIGT